MVPKLNQSIPRNSWIVRSLYTKFQSSVITQNKKVPTYAGVMLNAIMMYLDIATASVVIDTAAGASSYACIVKND